MTPDLPWKHFKRRRIPAIVGILLAILLLVLLALTDDPRVTATALWRAFRFPWGLVFGGLTIATLFDRKGGSRGRHTDCPQ